MTANREVYEGKILETLIKNSERLAVVEQKLIIIEQKIDNQDKKLNLILGAIVTIGLGILATLYSQPILNLV